MRGGKCLSLPRYDHQYQGSCYWHLAEVQPITSIARLPTEKRTCYDPTLDLSALPDDWRPNSRSFRLHCVPRALAICERDTAQLPTALQDDIAIVRHRPPKHSEPTSHGMSASP